MKKKTFINLAISFVIVSLFFVGWMLIFEQDDSYGIAYIFMFVIAEAYSAITGTIMVILVYKTNRLYKNIFFLTSWFANIGVSYFTVILLKEFITNFHNTSFIIFLPAAILAVVQTSIFIKMYKKQELAQAYK